MRDEILDGKQPVLRNAILWICNLRVAVQAAGTAAAGRVLMGEFPGAIGTWAGSFPVAGFKQPSAMGACKDVRGVAHILGNQITGEQVVGFSTRAALGGFDPKEVLNLCFPACFGALGQIQMSDFSP